MASSLVNNKYRITRRIGGGSFGEIYMGVGPNGEKVAVKFERHGTRCPQLRHEYKVYRELTGCHGFCQVYHFGQQDNYNVMVMDLLGPSLEDLFNKCNRRFSLKTVLQIADQMLERVDQMHSRHLIHRDIKPANFVIGVNDQAATIFCVDFGLSKRYRHPKNLQHIPHRDGRSLTGTPRYASINNHLGIEQSRRDDLESIGYVLIYFLKGTLPWQGLKAKNAQKKYRLIMEKKQQVSIAQLCQGCPSQFAEFLAYTRSLKFDAKPDIPYLRKLFRDLYHAQNCSANPKLWDWDGLDTDFSSTAGSANGNNNNMNNNTNAVPVIASAVRPTTAAAVNGTHALTHTNTDNDLLGEGFDEDVDLRASQQHTQQRLGMNDRPASALPYSNNNAANNNRLNNTAPAWGYTRNGEALNPVTGSGAVPVNTGGGMVLRSAAANMNAPHDPSGAGAVPMTRPHTAGVNMNTQPQAQMVKIAGVKKFSDRPMSGYEEQDDHLVAGARDMMRYRRSRVAETSQPQTHTQAQAQAQSGYVSNNNGSNATPWAYYQGTGRPGAAPAAMQRQSSTGMAMGAQPTQSGWSSGIADNRPRSATHAANATAGSSFPYPGTHAQAHSQAQAQQQWANSNSNSSSTLLHGTLKNRFLSGSSGAAPASAGVGVRNSAPPASSGMPSASMNNSNSNSGKSRLFSLAR